MASDWSIEQFDRRRHIRDGFDCGVPALNEWLITHATQHEKRDLARTYILTEASQPKVEGYYALSSHRVQYEVLPANQAKGLPQIDVPVVLIGRLAVHRSRHGQGLGEFLLLDALKRAEMLANQIGIRAVEVDAINDQAKQFYLRFGFIPLEDDPRHLILPMAIIRQLKLGNP